MEGEGGRRKGRGRCNTDGRDMTGPFTMSVPMQMSTIAMAPRGRGMLARM